MPQATNLLNDDGSASMATAFMMSHHGFRHDLARFAVALAKLAKGESSNADALREEWQSFRGALHGHHEVEDTRVFPSLHSEQAALRSVIERLTAEHRQIDPLLERGDRAFAALPAAAAVAAVVSELTALLDPHLALEEEKVMPFLRNAREFPPPANEAVLRYIGEPPPRRPPAP